jgi:hypothetical protein
MGSERSGTGGGASRSLLAARFRVQHEPIDGHGCMGDERLHEKEVVAVPGVRPAKYSLDGRLHAFFSGKKRAASLNEPAKDGRRMNPPLMALGVDSGASLAEPSHGVRSLP